MGIFWSLILFYFLGALVFSFFPNSKTKRKKEVIYYAFIAWFVLAARSPRNGVDLIGYCPMFERISTYSLEDSLQIKVANYEQGYTFFNKLISLISTDIHVFLAIIAATIIGLIAYIIYRYSTNIFLSFLIFVSFGLYTMCFSGLRQSLALAITFYSFKYLMDGKLMKFAITLFIASTFHTSALIFGFTWLFRKRELPLTLGLIIIAVYATIIIPSMKLLIGTLTSLLFEDKYVGYQEDQGGAYTMAIVYTVMYVGSYMFTKNDNRQIMNIYRWLILSSALFQSLGFVSAGAMPRIAYYFNIFYALFIPAVLSDLKPTEKTSASCVVAILFAAFFLFTISGGYLNIVPYHFFWEQGWANPERLPL